MSTQQQPTTTVRRPTRTAILALVLTGLFALRGVELGWSTPLTVMFIASMSLLALVPITAVVERGRARVR